MEEVTNEEVQLIIHTLKKDKNLDMDGSTTYLFLGFYDLIEG